MLHKLLQLGAQRRKINLVTRKPCLLLLLATSSKDFIETERPQRVLRRAKFLAQRIAQRCRSG